MTNVQVKFYLLLFLHVQAYIWDIYLLPITHTNTYACGIMSYVYTENISSSNLMNPTKIQKREKLSEFLAFATLALEPVRPLQEIYGLYIRSTYSSVFYS